MVGVVRETKAMSDPCPSEQRDRLEAALAMHLARTSPVSVEEWLRGVEHTLRQTARLLDAAGEDQDQADVREAVAHVLKAVDRLLGKV